MAAELCRGYERFLVHKQQGSGQNPEVTWSEVGSVEGLPLEVALWDDS